MRVARLLDQAVALCAGGARLQGAKLAALAIGNTVQVAPIESCSTSYWSRSYSYSSAPSSSGRSSSSFHTEAAPQGLPQKESDDEAASARAAAAAASRAAAAKAASHGGGAMVDPFALARDEVRVVADRLLLSVTSTVPALKMAAEYFFNRGVRGKQLRPTIVLLMASAIAPQTGAVAPEFLVVDTRPPSDHPLELRRQQQRLAEVAEMIHVASLLHDDVIDDASTRRGIKSLNVSVGNKLAILAGDFLLARASVSLAALRNTSVVELIAEVLEQLVSGEIMQMTAAGSDLRQLDHYLRKTYCKTASLMANSCRSAAVLAGQPPAVCALAADYGRHLGLAFQIVDDVLDLTASSSVLGKPALNDLKSGLATAPVLYAAEEAPALRPLIERRFKKDGDVSAAMALIEGGSGIRRAKELAAQHAQLAADSIRRLPPVADAHALLCREALIQLTHHVLTRSK